MIIITHDDIVRLFERLDEVNIYVNRLANIYVRTKISKNITHGGLLNHIVGNNTKNRIINWITR